MFKLEIPSGFDVVRTEQKKADEARQAARNAKQEANEARQAVFNTQQAAREVINEARRCKKTLIFNF